MDQLLHTLPHLVASQPEGSTQLAASATIGSGGPCLCVGV